MDRGTYTGWISDGKANGGGKLVFENGDDFDGIFVDNIAVGVGLITYHYTDGTPDNIKTVDADLSKGIHATAPVQQEVTDHEPLPIAADLMRPMADPNDGIIHPVIEPAGIFVYTITFHEGFRAPGLKALDVNVTSRSTDGENNLVRGDEIISATGTSGKVYNMKGSKGTSVTRNFLGSNFQEYRLIQYIDVDASEKNIESVVLEHNGKLITLKVTHKAIVTHA
ncbi:MAG TPA: hypothetical protein VFC84_10825 [Desulfosporosinus sp.]|nr:hypothetical protein [Desulfosporosinus sp.]